MRLRLYAILPIATRQGCLNFKVTVRKMRVRVGTFLLRFWMTVITAWATRFVSPDGSVPFCWPPFLALLGLSACGCACARPRKKALEKEKQMMAGRAVKLREETQAFRLGKVTAAAFYITLAGAFGAKRQAMIPKVLGLDYTSVCGREKI